MSETGNILIGDVEAFSIVDFPSHIAAVAFLQGCPWRCPFCYNASLQPLKQIRPSDWTFEKFLKFIERRKGMLDAVVFSGGEPLVQEGLFEAVKKVKDLGYTIGLHTGGYRPEHLKKVLPLLDWVGLDMKGPKAKYALLTGGFNAFNEVQKSLQILIDSNIHFECRTTCDPRELTVEDLFEVGKFLKDMGVKEYYLQKYRPIETDKSTTDTACESLISDEKLISFLSQSFQKFELRR
ncbi:MAG: anaerobic ribonucleoside-triphosphate reductase activating protein [Alphaproteobacteria bacterium]|nr:anaerobic ribonucleoside-triphosphate reductase activating protein [Alphaproteobacteria bacterium]